MNSELLSAVQAYKDGLTKLNSIVLKTEKAIISENDRDLLFSQNVNFFAKSFLISICAHLEMCVKEIVFSVATELDKRLSIASIPATIIEWRYGQRKKGDIPGQQIPPAGIGMTRKEVDDLVSGNVYKTKDALALVGVEITADKLTWDTWKEQIQSMVTRRNNIVHHNDSASDLSLGDIRQYISLTIDYIEFITDACGTKAA